MCLYNKKNIAVIVAFIISTISFGQKKHWYDKYWLSTSGVVIVNNPLGSGGVIDIGRNAKNNYAYGISYAMHQFSKEKKANIFSVYGEKYKTDKGKQLYIMTKIGIATPQNPKELAASVSRHTFESASPALHLQAGAGIRFMVHRSAFFCNISYAITNLKLRTTEYPIPVNPYNPFFEESIRHSFNFKQQNIVIAFGVRL